MEKAPEISLIQNAVAHLLDAAGDWHAIEQYRADLILGLHRVLVLIANDVPHAEQLAAIDNLAIAVARGMASSFDIAKSTVLAKGVNDLAVMVSLQPPKLTASLHQPDHRRGEFGVAYFVRRAKAAGEELVERRPSSAGAKRRDFHVSRYDYDAAMYTLGLAAKPMKFDDLYRRFVGLGGRDVRSGYPLRAALRFWRSIDPPLVKRSQAKYSVTVTEQSFRERATKAWEALPK